MQKQFLSTMLIITNNIDYLLQGAHIEKCRDTHIYSPSIYLWDTEKEHLIQLELPAPHTEPDKCSQYSLLST